MSRLQTGAVRPRAEQTSADDLVARGIAGVSRRARRSASRRASRCRSSTDLPVVRADPGLLERVLANLVENALRHTAGHRRPDHGECRRRAASRSG